MSQEIKTTLDFKDVGKIVMIPDGVADQDAVNVRQLHNAISDAGIASRNIDGGFASETYLSTQNFDGGGA